MRHPSANSRLAAWFILIAVPLGLGLYSLSLGQDTNWDLQNYHWYNPYAFLNGRLGKDLAPAGLQSYFNPLIDLPYYLASKHAHPKLAGFLLALTQGLNFVFLLKIAERVVKPLDSNGKTPLLLALLGLLTVGFLSELGTTINDSLTSIFNLAALSLALSEAGAADGAGRRSLRWFALAGLLAGLGCGFKLTNAIFTLALSLSLLLLPLPWSGRAKVLLVFGLSSAAGFILAGGYWLYTIWLQFGNPLFPQFNHIFHSELAPPEPIRDIRFLPRSLAEKLVYPVIFTADPMRVGEFPYKQISWLIAYAAIVGLFGNRLYYFFTRKSAPRRLCPEAKLVIAYLSIAYLLWLNLFGIYRYLISIEMLIPLVLFVIATHLSKAKWIAPATMALLTLVTLYNLRGIPDWGRAAWDREAFHADAQALRQENPAVILLVYHPLAWLVPVLDTDAAIIQISPNFPVSAAYWRRAKSLVDGHPGKRFVMFDPGEDRAKINYGLAKLRLARLEGSCKLIEAYMGSRKFPFNYCEVVDRPASQNPGDVEWLVENWGPQSMTVGDNPNQQADGGLGIWFRVPDAEGIGEVQVIFNGHAVPAAATNHVITTSVPPNLLQTPGVMEIAIKQVSSGKTFPVSTFTLHPKQQ